MTKKSISKILGLLLVVGLLFAALPSGQAEADWSTFDNPDYYYADITTAPADTYYRSAGYSPDGTKIVAQKQWIDGTVTKREVVLMDADGSDEIVISPGNSGTGDIYQHGNPFWSDDGTVIGFVEVHNDNPNKVVVYNVAAGTTSYIYEPISPADVSNPDFLGNSYTSIVFWAYGTVEGADLWTWDGTTLTNITNTDDFKEYEPISNADGSVILYWSGESTAEPVNTTHTLTNVGGTWTKDVGFTPIADTYWSYWTTPAATQIATTIMSSKDIAIYNNTGVLVKDLTGPAYSGGSGQWNFFGSMPQGPNGDFIITSNAGRGTTAGRDIVVANPRILLYVSTTTGSDDNPGTENAPFATIGKAINEAVDGATIHVAAGTYAEQVKVTKNLTILGAGKNVTTIQSPDTLVPSFYNGANPYKAVVTFENAVVTLDGFTIDGLGKAVGNVRFTGIGLHNAGGTIKKSIIKGFQETPFSAVLNNGLGIYAFNDNGTQYTINIEDNTIQEFQQNGITVRAGDTTPVIMNVLRNTITGAGPTPLAQQIGITLSAQLGTGTVSDNAISGINHDRGTLACGYSGNSIQLVNVDMNVLSNTITGARVGIHLTGISGDILDNNVTTTQQDGCWNMGIAVMTATGDVKVKGNILTNAYSQPVTQESVGIFNNDTATPFNLLIDDNDVINYQVGIKTGQSILTITNNTVTSLLTDIRISGAPTVSAEVHKNALLGADLKLNNATTTLQLVDAELNYWGSPCGPAAGKVVGNVDYTPWYTDAAMTMTSDVAVTYNFTPATGTVAINEALACAAPGSTFNFAAGDYSAGFVIPAGRDHTTIVLADGVKVTGTSPCFDVNADFTTIRAETIGMAACVTVAGSNGIDVAAGLKNLTIDGLEIYGAGNDGIHFNGVITDVVLKDNLIHNLAGNGVFFGAQPVAQTAGAIDIHGNMFQNNALKGIEAGAYIVPAKYNSWGDVLGANLGIGDGASTGVDADPFTHVDLYLVSSGTPWANQVVSGQTITYTVMGHLVNANGADFVLTYPENLTYVSSTAGTTFGADIVTHTEGIRTLHFLGYSITGNKTGTLPLFSVTFTAGAPVLNAPMLLDELTDGFGMITAGSSSNIYAAALLDSTVTIVTLPTISSTDIQGYYLSGEQRQFSVVLDNPSTGADYAHVYVDFTMTNAKVEQISLIEYSVDNGANWVALGTGPGTSFANSGTDIVGYFGKMPGGGFPLAHDTSLTTLFRVTFVIREQGATDFPTSYAVSMKLMDADALPSALQLDDFTDTMYIYDKAALTIGGMDPYFIVNEVGDFNVTINNPTTGKYYTNTVVFDISVQGPVGGGISTLTCSSYGQTWTLTGLIADGAGLITARLVGPVDGYFIMPNLGDNEVISCEATFTKEGAYTPTVKMVDVINAVGPVERVVGQDSDDAVIVYLKPVITPTNLAGPFDAGVPETVGLSIVNTLIPEPFKLVFTYPAGTVIVYNSVTYTCTTTCPPISVDLTTEPTVLNFTVTFDEAWTGNVSVSLFDIDWPLADRLLATASDTGGVVNGDFDVTGTFSMQGRSTRAGIPVTLTWGGSFASYVRSAPTIESISNNFSLTLTYGGMYTITTNQARYLDVTSDSLKTITVSGDRTLTPLQLVGGDANDNNHVYTEDAGIVGGNYGKLPADTGYDERADLNFDNRVNIQDLALLGGNYNKTSASVYGTGVAELWIP